MRLILSLLSLTLAAALAVAAWAWQDWQRFEIAAINPEAELMLWLAPGANWALLIRDLERLGLAQSSWHWRLMGRLDLPALKAGEYLVPQGTPVPGLIDLLAAGRTRSHRLTIIEGWTLARLRSTLASDPRLRSVAGELDDAALMEALGCAGCFAEGRFLPETYFFERGSTDLALLQRSFEAMNRLLSEAWAQRDPDLPLANPDELLVLASIIERETGQGAERPRVAGVFTRRLQLGMRLQTDPTVVYGLGDDFDGRLRRVHLQTDHPWNTYTRHGLPPTPIALPGRASVLAAASPADGTALYFVARGDGTHQFSDTLEQHNAAVNRYIRGRR